MSEQMKPSGIDWIGDIPIDWEIGKVRFVTALRGEKGFYTEKDKYIGLENISSYTGEYLSSETEYDSGIYDVYKKGDLLFNKLRPYLAKALIANDDGFCTGELEVISEYKGDKRYLFYYLLSDGFLKMVDASTYGTKMPRANWDYIKNFSIPLLPSKEQQAIADYLDKQCNKIDGIISDLETQIDTLQRYKKSLILETVTKGLKKAPMKPSGIDWIGDIPGHWALQRIKDISTMQTGTTPPNNEGINFDNDGSPWFTPGDFTEGSIVLRSSEKNVDNETIQRESIRLYPKHSILFVGIASIGKLGYFEHESYSNQQITAVKPNNIKSSKFIAYALLASMDYTKSNALYTTVPIINNAYLGLIKIPFPNIDEQIIIADYLDARCAKIDMILQDKQTQLETIKQHKKSLIYEYVTGKKRVKEKCNGN